MKGVNKPWERASRRLGLCLLHCVCVSHGAGGGPAFTSQRAEVSVYEPHANLLKIAESQALKVLTRDCNSSVY